MSGKISDMPAAGAIAGTELIEIVQGGQNKKSTVGTAAAAMLTTGPTDNTTGRVLRIGGNGWHGGNAPNDAAWTSTTTFLNGWTGTVWYKKTLGMVTVTALLNGASATNNNTGFAFPSGYRPGVTQHFAVGHVTGDSNATVETTGAITIVSRASVVRLCVTFPTI